MLSLHIIHTHIAHDTIICHYKKAGEYCMVSLVINRYISSLCTHINNDRIQYAKIPGGPYKVTQVVTLD